PANKTGTGMHASSSPPAPPPAGYSHTRTYTLNPRLLPWLTPLCLLIIFVLMFFPWVGMYPSGIGVITQNGWNVAFGGFSNSDKVWVKYYGTNETDNIVNQVGVALWLVLYLLVLLPTLVIALAGAMLQNKLIPVELPPAFQNYWSFRPVLLVLLNVAALVFLVFQLVVGLPLEKVTAQEVDKKVSATRPDRPSDEDDLKLKLDAGREVGKFNLETTTWVHLALLLQAVALLGAALEFWLERRGPTLPPPRVDVLT
ncbi:MAG: hypothetical protein K2R98_30040, partial [Gemmataceae bacterium]|nr:hypothetical protein [Gemmataceae bacterium]